jgi:energy-coupling factor transport system permease protein
MMRLTPQIALLLTFEAAILLLVAERPVNLALLTGLAALFWLTGPSRRWRGVMLAALLLGTWSVVAGQGLFFAGEPRTALLRLASPEWFPFSEPPGLYVYREGLWHGLVQALRFDAMILLGAGLLSRYATDELAEGMRALHVPAAICFLFSIALRFLPLLWEETRATWTAQHMRGFRLTGPGALPRLPTSARVLVLPLIASNVRKADEIAAALLGRGFDLPADQPARVRRAGHAERFFVWGGAAGLAGLGSALLLTRLHLHGAFSVEWLDWVYLLVSEYV